MRNDRNHPMAAAAEIQVQYNKMKYNTKNKIQQKKQRFLTSGKERRRHKSCRTMQNKTIDYKHTYMHLQITLIRSEHIKHTHDTHAHFYYYHSSIS